VFISEFTRSDVGKHLRIDHRNTRVICNGIALSGEEPLPLPLPTERKFLLSIGKFHPRKNLLSLVRMMPFLEDFALVLAGDDSGACAEEVRSLVHRLKLGDRVFIIGKVSEGGKRWLYEKCEFLVMPSSHEGFGLPVVEAHSLGVPAIVSRLAALPEIAGPDAFYFSSLVPEEMANDVKEATALLARVHISEALKQNAARFSWERAAAGYEEIYRGLQPAKTAG
jgi:glycosyltransferase involved in cell wall biosynthesis